LWGRQRSEGRGQRSEVGYARASPLDKGEGRREKSNVEVEEGRSAGKPAGEGRREKEVRG